MITVLFAVKSYIIRKGLVSIMQNLNLEFNHEEIRQADLLLKIQNKTEKQIIFLCPDDFPELVGNLLIDRAKNTRVFIINNSDTTFRNNSSFEVIDIQQTKNALQNQIIKIFRSLKDNGKKDELTETLSDREKIVMRELVLGYTNKEIADRLFISPHTVIAHRKNITGKLGIKSVPGLTIYAILHKIINEEDIKRATQPSDPDPHK